MSTYEISKSSLLSLKAEVLRKQEEINKAKLQNKFKRQKEPKKLTPLEVKNKGIEQREIQDSQEDIDLLQKSRTTLEHKARLYDKLCKSDKTSSKEENEHIQKYLVHFDKKKYDNGESSDHENQEEENFNESVYEPVQNPDEEWVEYIDCLGRTRTCMKKDLEFLKSKDEDLRAAVEKDSNKAEQLVNRKEQEKKSEEDLKPLDENNELLSIDMKREIMRQQWEKEEAELTKKENIHYQDVLFNEARTHGVGYYAFSKDEEERKRQQEALKKLRQETEQQQKKAQLLKQQREKQLKARIRAAKNRKRARLGLPLLEDNEDDEEEGTQQFDEEKEKEEEEKKRKQEELEKEKIQKSKETHIRPWDIGKEGVKEHYVYTQEEWVAKQRNERPQEFAPPQQYKRSNFRSFDSYQDHKEDENNKKLYFSSKKEEKSKTLKHKWKSSNPYKNSDTNEEAEKSPIDKNTNSDNSYKMKYSINSEEFDIKGKTKNAEFQSSLIVNECSDNEEDRLLKDYNVISNSVKESYSRGRGAEIAPPSTLEYYGPNSTSKKAKYEEKQNIEEAISAGLKFLRNQFEKKKPNNRDDEMFIM